MLSDKQRFTEQSNVFIDAALEEVGAASLASLPDLPRTATALEPVLVEDLEHLKLEEKQRLLAQYMSNSGVAYFICTKIPELDRGRHPLFILANQLEDTFRLHYPLEHPLETHPETLLRFGGGDSTVKVYDLAVRERGYREQGETSERFEMHHDGLGSAGTVQTVVLYAESAPLWGGFTYFQNIVRLGLELAKLDSDAFKSLFLPDAITVTRPRGKGALRVTGPVLYLNEQGRPQSFFRRESGEYQVEWQKESGHLQTAREFLEEFTRPFSSNSSFIHFTSSGEGCLIRNRVVAHGRSRFIDDARRQRQRVLARKWYMRRPVDIDYKHVPGLLVDSRYARFFPEFFGSDVLQGEWLLNTSGRNERIR